MLQNIDNIPYNVKYILEPVLYPVDCSSHTSTPIIAPSHLSPLVTTTVYFVISESAFLLYSLVWWNFYTPYKNDIKQYLSMTCFT